MTLVNTHTTVNNYYSFENDLCLKLSRAGPRNELNAMHVLAVCVFLHLCLL